MNGLNVIFFTQMFERFAYYGLRSILVLFLVDKFAYLDSRVAFIMLLFMSFIYTLPLITSFLTDRVFGMQRMIKVGLSLSLLGQATMILSYFNDYFVFLSLAFLALGTSYYKANITNLTGEIFDKNDPARLPAFTFVHIGINIGAFFSPIISGYLCYFFGWYAAFVVASLMVLLSSLIFFFNAHHFKGKGLLENNIVNKKFFNLSALNIFFILSVIAALGFSLIFQTFTTMSSYISLIFLSMFFVLFGYIMFSTKEYLNLTGALFLLIFNVLFFSMQSQLGVYIVLLAKRNVVDSLFGFYIPPAIGQAINPMAVILGGLLISYFAKIKSATLQFYQFLTAFFFLILSFGIIYVGCLTASEGKISYLYYFIALALTGLVELYFIPFLQSNLNILSPQSAKSFINGAWMLSISFGFALASKYIIEIPKNTDVLTSLQLYQEGYKNLFLFNIVAFIALLPLAFAVKYIISKNKKD